MIPRTLTQIAAVMNADELTAEIASIDKAIAMSGNDASRHRLAQDRAVFAARLEQIRRKATR